MGPRARRRAAGDTRRTQTGSTRRARGGSPGSQTGSPAQPKPAAQPAAEAADPLLAYLNSTPAAPAEPETPKPDDATDGSADGAAYSLDDILAEFSDF